MNQKTKRSKIIIKIDRWSLKNLVNKSQPSITVYCKIRNKLKLNYNYLVSKLKKALKQGFL